MDPRASVTRCASPVLTRAGERFACRRCDYCLWRDARELQRRCEREYRSLKAGRIAFMGSVTFADEALRVALAQDKPGQAAWRACSVRLMQLLADACGGQAQGVKLFAVPELGKLHGRLHVHFIAFGVPEVLTMVVKHEGPKRVAVSRFRELVRQAWPHGIEKCDAIWSLGGVRYVLKYVRKGVGPLRQARVPQAASWWWCAWPRGRVGGLARQHAEGLAVVAERAASVRAGIDVPAYLIGSGGKRVGLTRYERDVMRRTLALDSPRAKLQRRARNPEVVEMAARVAQAGSVQALRAVGGHRDDDVASVWNAKARKAQELGRW